MNRDQARELLITVASCDPRWAPSGVDVDAWHLVLGERTDLADARQAVADHYRESPHRITPADVYRRAKAMRTERVPAIEAPTGGPKPPWFVEQVQASLAAASERIGQLRRGRPAGTGTFGEGIAQVAGVGLPPDAMRTPAPVDEQTRQRQLAELEQWQTDHPETAPQVSEP